MAALLFNAHTICQVDYTIIGRRPSDQKITTDITYKKSTCKEALDHFEMLLEPDSASRTIKEIKVCKAGKCHTTIKEVSIQSAIKILRSPIPRI